MDTVFHFLAVLVAHYKARCSVLFVRDTGSTAVFFIGCFHFSNSFLLPNFSFGIFYELGIFAVFNFYFGSITFD